MTNAVSSLDFALARPELFLLGASCLLLLVDLFVTDRNRQISYLLALLTLLVTAVFEVGYLLDSSPVRDHSGNGAPPAQGVVGILLCAGTFNEGSFAVDFAFSKRYDAYAGVTCQMLGLLTEVVIIQKYYFEIFCKAKCRTCRPCL